MAKKKNKFNRRFIKQSFHGYDAMIGDVVKFEYAHFDKGRGRRYRFSHYETIIGKILNITNRYARLLTINDKGKFTYSITVSNSNFSNPDNQCVRLARDFDESFTVVNRRFPIKKLLIERIEN